MTKKVIIFIFLNCFLIIFDIILYITTDCVDLFLTLLI